MHIICSWCRREGRIGLVGEKDPIEDRRETHGICPFHFEAARKEWQVVELMRRTKELVHAPMGTDASGAVSGASGGFRLSPARWWKELKHLVRKAAGF
jgi:hypothetical protein